MTCSKMIKIFASIFLILFVNNGFSATKNPNIIIFLVDDLGWMDIGCHGSKFYKTPNIDRLAAEGVRFTDAYAACAVCSPTRASILTGKYPARLLLTNWLPAGRWDPNARLYEGRFLRSLPPEEITLAEALRNKGYSTAHIGKWHLGGPPFSLPEHHGFDVNIAGNSHGAPGSYFYPYAGDWKIPTTGKRAKWNTLKDGKKGEYLTDRLTDEAIKFVKENKEKPFFLHLSHYAVHTPLQSKKELTEKYQKIPKLKRQGNPIYAAMVESVDQSLGRISDLLKEESIDDETLIIFTSDNGGFAKATDNSPLRANKGAYYEGGIRVPLIVRWPSKIKQGKLIDTPVISPDIYPTCLAAANSNLKDGQICDGINLLPVIMENHKIDRSSIYWHFPHYNGHPSSFPTSVIRKGEWKLIEAFDPSKVELYYLNDDISEKQDLAEIRTDIRDQLLSELNSWRKEVGAEMMKINQIKQN